MDENQGKILGVDVLRITGSGWVISLITSEIEDATNVSVWLDYLGEQPVATFIVT